MALVPPTLRIESPFINLQKLTAAFLAQIKADRGEVEASDDTIKKMQQETAQSAEAEKKQ